MPFKSEAQRRYMYARHPAIAKRWSAEYPNQGKLPARAKRKRGGLTQAVRRRQGR